MLLGALLLMTTAGASSAQPATSFDDAVREIATTVGREYFDEAVGLRVAKYLMDKLERGGYRSAGTPGELATSMTEDLFAETADRHLGIRVLGEANPESYSEAGVEKRAQELRVSNGGIQRVEILVGNVGYLNLTAFWRLEEAREAITNGMSLLDRADALIIDLRENGGGAPGSLELLASYFFEEKGLPLFEIVSRSGRRNLYRTSPDAQISRNENRPVFVLTSSKTFSAGEGFAYLLQERGRAKVVGEATAGAANPSRPYAIQGRFEVTIPTGKVVSAVRVGNWEGSGVAPDIKTAAADALKEAHVMALRELLAQVSDEARRQWLEASLLVAERE